MPGRIRVRWALVVLLVISGIPSRASAASLQERLAPCLACHGATGQSEIEEVPSLGGQPAFSMLIQLFLFRERQRRVEIMNEATKDLADNDLRLFSDELAKLPKPKPPAAAPDAARMERGRTLSRTYRCGFCHNPDYSGREQMPRLAAQREDYLVKAMREYKSNIRSGYDASMADVLYPLKDNDILDLAYYLAHQR